MKSIIITALALALGTMSASAFPTDWAAQGKTCADAGLRKDEKPAWCQAHVRKGCVPCPREHRS
jgi:hypothetical protein